MLGFKLESTRNEGSVERKARPIYLDLQARIIYPPLSLSNP
jgi:hypothetical protein